MHAESLELISEVAAHVNKSIRQVDNFKKLLDVQKKLVGDTGDSLISPSRVSILLVSLLHLMLLSFCYIEVTTRGRAFEVF